MNVRTRSSAFTVSSVGPWRFASASVFVFVSARWTFFCSSGRAVSSRLGDGTASAIVGHSSARPPALTLRAKLLQVEVAFDPAEEIVGDDTTLAQVEGRAAFRLDQLASYLRVLEQLLFGGPGFGAVVQLRMGGAVLVLRTQRVDELLVCGPLRFEIVETREGGLGRERARPRLRVGLIGVGHQSEGTDDRGKSETLTDKRDQDHRERKEQDEIAPGETSGQRERSGERDHAAQTRPADDRDGSPGRRRVRAPEDREDLTLDPHDRKDPQESSEDDHEHDRRGGRERGPVERDIADDGGQLQTQQKEHEAVQDEEPDLPYRRANDARVRRGVPQRVPRPKARGDGREHARHDEGPRGLVSREGRD